MCGYCAAAAPERILRCRGAVITGSASARRGSTSPAKSPRASPAPPEGVAWNAPCTAPPAGGPYFGASRPGLPLMHETSLGGNLAIGGGFHASLRTECRPRRRAGDAPEPLALARQVAARDSPLRRARLPVGRLLRVDGDRVLRGALHRALP